MEKIEYRVRPVTRYIVTRFYDSVNAAGVDTIGEFEHLPHANKVAVAMASAAANAVATPMEETPEPLCTVHAHTGETAAQLLRAAAE